MKKFIRVFFRFIINRYNNILRWIAIIKLHKLMINVREKYDNKFPRVYSKVKRDYKTYLNYHDFLENSSFIKGIDYKSVRNQGSKEYLDKLHSESLELVKILRNIIDLDKEDTVLSKTKRLKCKD